MDKNTYITSHYKHNDETIYAIYNHDKIIFTDRRDYVRHFIANDQM